MRLRVRGAAVLVLVLALTASATLAAAQEPEELLPEQSAAKARAILQQVITTLGGRAFLDARDSDCTGRLAQIGHNGELNGYVELHDQWLLPDKNRKEYIGKGSGSLAGFLLGVNGPVISSKGMIVTLFNGNEGWVRDNKGAVSSQPEDVVKNFTEQMKSSMDYVLRSRLNEKDMTIRYAGSDLVELKAVDWIEFTGPDGNTLRLAVDQSTHLPLRWEVMTRDPVTREQNETVTTYAQFHALDGIRVPFNITQQQNGRVVYQIFLTSCKFDSNLSPQLFTRASLEHR
jgi:hypothetical protein